MPISYFVVDSTADLATDDFFEDLEEMVARLADQGLGFSPPSRQETDVQVIQTWPLAGADASLTLYDNQSTGIRHLEVSAADAELHQQLVSAVTESLPIQRHEELVQRWLDGEHSASLLLRVAISADDPPSGKTVDLIVDALGDPDRELRAHAAYCAGLIADQRFEIPLLQRAEVEQDGAVLDNIDLALEVLGVA